MSALMRLLRSAIAVLVSSAAMLAAQPRTTQLPASLSNAQFWSIVSDYSEAGGTFATDNFTSNELAVGQIASDLIAANKMGGAFVGVGPEQNFTYIAAIRPRIAFIVDIRRQAVMQHLMFKAVFEMSANRSEFIARLFARPLQPAIAGDSRVTEIWVRYLDVQALDSLAASHLAAILHHLGGVRGFSLTAGDSNAIRLVYNAFVRHGPAISYASQGSVTASVAQRASAGLSNFATLTAISDTSGVARSFLASEENFRLVKDLHTRNLIVPVVGNFAGSQALRRIGEFLRQHGVTVTAYYVSNVEQYLSGPAGTLGAFYSNVATLPLDSSSVFIRPGRFPSSSLALQLVRNSGMTRTLEEPGLPRASPGTTAPDPAAAPPPPQFIFEVERERPGAALCPIIPFLAAHAAGRVISFSDALQCPR
jgi:hypothetical protein